MHRSALPAAIAASVALALGACPGAEDGDSAPDPGPVERSKIEPFTYPAPVSGHLSEANAGEFDLVDGIAYSAREAGKGTVVFVSAKPIASPVLATSSCPATQARALKLLRDASYVEVTLDAAGRSKTFIYWSPYGGQGRGIDVGGGEWRGRIATAGRRAEGSVTHRYYGAFEFDLPLARTQPTEVSEEDRMAAGYAA